LRRKREVPVQFLEQLFAVLRRAGIISSQRGVKGGYRFARDPSTISVLEIVELLDGPLGRDAQGTFRRRGPRPPARCWATHHDRGCDRARGARGRGQHVPHMSRPER